MECVSYIPNIHLIVSNAKSMISLIQYIVYIELIKLQTKNLINNLIQGPTPLSRVCSHCELCNIFYRLHLVVGMFSIDV